MGKLQASGQWITISGQIIGILNPDCLAEACRPTLDRPILVIIPQTLAFGPGRIGWGPLKAEPSLVQSQTSDGGPSTPSRKRISHNPFASSPSKPAAQPSTDASSPPDGQSIASHPAPTRHEVATASTPSSPKEPIALDSTPDAEPGIFFHPLLLLFLLIIIDTSATCNKRPASSALLAMNHRKSQLGRRLY